MTTEPTIRAREEKNEKRTKEKKKENGRKMYSYIAKSAAYIPTTCVLVLLSTRLSDLLGNRKQVADPAQPLSPHPILSYFPYFRISLRLRIHLILLALSRRNNVPNNENLYLEWLPYL